MSLSEGQDEITEPVEFGLSLRSIFFTIIFIIVGALLLFGCHPNPPLPPHYPRPPICLGIGPDDSPPAPLQQCGSATAEGFACAICEADTQACVTIDIVYCTDLNGCKDSLCDAKNALRPHKARK